MRILQSKSLHQYLTEFRVVLACGEQAREEVLSLDAKLAKAKLGPYQHTRWLDNIAKNFDSNARVSLLTLSNTQNCLAVRFGDEVVHFSLFFGTFENSEYRIHMKGPERKKASPLQWELFEPSEFEEFDGERVYAYALLVPSVDETRGGFYELHVFFGLQVSRGESWKDSIRPGENLLIVTSPKPQVLAPVEEVSFIPSKVKK